MSIEWADKIFPVIRRLHEDVVVVWIKIRFPIKGIEKERIINWGVAKEKIIKNHDKK